MSKAGDLLGIELLDHVIVAQGKHCSLRETFPDKKTGLFAGGN
jgi:DNA repair protein RadC